MGHVFWSCFPLLFLKKRFGFCFFIFLNNLRIFFIHIFHSVDIHDMLLLEKNKGQGFKFSLKEKINPWVKVFAIWETP